MKLQWIILLSAVFSGTFFSIPASAFWCDNNLITEGTSKYAVLEHCGEPDFTERYHKFASFYFRGGWFQMPVIVDEWTYNFGPTRLIRVLDFRDGKLLRVRTDDRGY